jgi:hypothetical protein
VLSNSFIGGDRRAEFHQGVFKWHSPWTMDSYRKSDMLTDTWILPGHLVGILIATILIAPGPAFAAKKSQRAMASQGCRAILTAQHWDANIDRIALSPNYALCTVSDENTSNSLLMHLSGQQYVIVASSKPAFGSVADLETPNVRWVTLFLTRRTWLKLR